MPIVDMCVLTVKFVFIFINKHNGKRYIRKETILFLETFYPHGRSLVMGIC